MIIVIILIIVFTVAIFALLKAASKADDDLENIKEEK